MINFHKINKIGKVVLGCAIWLGMSAPVSSATFTVTNVLDSGSGSFRQAINDANGNSGPDSINFNIPSGQHRISLSQQLPIITETVLIDGYTQAGSRRATYSSPAELRVTLDGAGINYSAHGLFVNETDNVQIQGLSFINFSLAAIRIDNGNRNKVQGNHIGHLALCLANHKFTCETGGNGYGVGIVNDFGTDPNGNLFTSNNNLVGGDEPWMRNVISYSTVNDVYIQKLTPNGAGGADSNTIQGNYIGTDALGGYPTTANPIFNIGNGVAILNASNTIIGGSARQHLGNLIATKQVGINLGYLGVNSAALGTLIQGNELMFNQYGIRQTARESIIGGSKWHLGNVVAGGSVGISILDDGTNMTNNQITANYLGVSRLAYTQLTPPQTGISISGSQNTIGGYKLGNYVRASGNAIEVKRTGGVTASLNHNRISQNTTISTIAGIGIDLGDDGITYNDRGDIDSGPNTLLNYPVIAEVISNYPAAGASIRLEHDYVESAEIELFSSATCNRQTERYVGGGFTKDKTLRSPIDLIVRGPTSINTPVQISTLVVPGEFVVATASIDGNTSEISDCVVVQ